MAFEVGTDVEAMCSKCGDVWHVVFAKIGDMISKVECKQCGKRHRFKATGDAPEANLAPARKAAARSSRADRATKGPGRGRASAPAAAVFDPSKPTSDYRGDRRFAVGEQIRHPVFGTGVVSAVEANKIRVSFAGNLKVLRCGSI
ncbi:MAG: hypothetical protein ACOCVR_01760 [Myxococcota bacterium]